MKQIEYLDIAGSYSPLYNLRRLKELHVGTKITNTQFEELQNCLPNTIIIIRG